MRKQLKPRSTIAIYTMQYSLIVIASIFFIIGIMRVKATETMDVISLVWLLSGAFLYAASYIYAKKGVKIIQTACPYCYGTGYIDMGTGKNKRQETCPVCHGTGKMLDKATIELEKERERIKKEKKEEKKLQNPVPKEEQQNNSPWYH